MPKPDIGGFRIEGDPQFLHLDNAAIAGDAARMRAPGGLTADDPQQKETIASPEAMGEASAPQRRHETASMPGDIPFHFAARIDT